MLINLNNIKDVKKNFPIEKIISVSELTSIYNKLLFSSSSDLISNDRIRVCNQSETIFSCASVNTNNEIPFFGFRAYPKERNRHSTPDIISIYNTDSGEPIGTLLTNEIVPLKNAALSCLVFEKLGIKKIENLGSIGCGIQAKAQISAICSSFNVENISMYSRNSNNLSLAAEELINKTNKHVCAQANVEKLVKESDILIVATNSPVPTFDIDWLPKNIHINHIGEKREESHDVPRSLYDVADFIVIDNYSQASVSAENYLSELIDENNASFDLKDISGNLSKNYKRSIFATVGHGALDLILANEVLQRCH